MRYLGDNLQSEFSHVKRFVTGSLTYIEEKNATPFGGKYACKYAERTPDIY